MTETPVKGVAIMWNPYVPTLVAATREFPWLDLKVYSHRLAGENPEVLDQARLCVEISGLEEPAARMEMMERLLDYKERTPFSWCSSPTARPILAWGPAPSWMIPMRRLCNCGVWESTP